ncbi:GlsB/YeaQ/YmgE family stress response membrane protein [Enemella evansiae]|uniref:GlsB/YeaQ/YmgE family stress response membrane protein n=1 Tax=Enemella evansiae TaxID=2016499 RepID=A0A255GDD2_9ACTN|nr:GlsB/YeaQ/YmgE family stress response membrane protein [Enemella evansiae]OYN95576.1 GlsB/YeaQ/YmgE family stress response membrane protein [Enemella evansiae]OYO00329.1 GlsB/YeaQ/YmgE family stress response membrane protein [Enemella evansiae]OYO03681.1 GlsB/YeaQ/YmgE family stress response membrane protein [Enemella evansiae]OYO10107.1 GlsB/YeaQ/YmgE family stress response membrane protein [Enemella evansiae]OYO10282.1 GlsB/YeaQ/YmgE family stress response membrane protein [Enemella evans
MGTIIAYIVIGLLGGAIAKAILPGKQGGGIVVTMILGIVGALLGGFIGGALFGVSYSSVFSWQGLITSIIGALIILIIYGLVTKRRGTAA